MFLIFYNPPLPFRRPSWRRGGVHNNSTGSRLAWQNLPRSFSDWAPLPSGFSSFEILGGRGGWLVSSPPPVVIWPPRILLGRPVMVERVYNWLLQPASTSCTGGTTSSPQNFSHHPTKLPNSLCESFMCALRTSQFLLHTSFR